MFGELMSPLSQGRELKPYPVGFYEVQAQSPLSQGRELKPQRRFGRWCDGEVAPLAGA